MTSAAQSHPVRPRPGATALRLSHPTSSALLFAFAALQAIGAAGCTYQVIQLIPHRLRHGMGVGGCYLVGHHGCGRWRIRFAFAGCFFALAAIPGEAGTAAGGAQRRQEEGVGRAFHGWSSREVLRLRARPALLVSPP